MRKFLAAVLAILFVVTMLVSIVLFTLDNRLMNPVTYKSALATQQVYSRMPRIIAEQLIMTMNFDPCAENPFVCENITPEFKQCAVLKLGQERIDILVAVDETPTIKEMENIKSCVEQYIPKDVGQIKNGPPGFMQSLTPANWEEVLSGLLPPSILKPMAESLIDITFNYLNGEENTVSVSLVALKNRLSGPEGVDALMELIRSQPPCDAAGTEAMVAALAGGATPQTFCSPQEEKLQELKPEIKNLLANAARSLPDEKVLLTPDTGENSAFTGPFGGGLVGAFRLARLVFRLSPEIPLGILLLITLLVVRTPRSWLRWWGIPLFFSGLLAVIAAVLSILVFEQTWINILASKIPPGISLGVVELVRGLMNSILRRLMLGILICGLLTSIPGLMMWIGSIFIKIDKSLETSLS
jgi:hypothetical protein